MRSISQQQVWRVSFTLPAGHADNNQRYSRTMQQIVIAKSVERALATVRERFGDIPIWSVNHMSMNAIEVLLDESPLSGMGEL